MTTIRTTCSSCGEVDLEPEGVKLIHGERATYRFICPVCGRTVNKMTDDKIIALLLTAGVNWRDEAPARHPDKPDPDAPPLTYDDAIDFHKELEELDG